MNIVSPLVELSVKHKEILRKLADRLASVLDDTKKYAATALEAARVYKTIVDAIEDAMKAARLANVTVNKANKKVRFFPYSIYFSGIWVRLNSLRFFYALLYSWITAFSYFFKKHHASRPYSELSNSSIVSYGIFCKKI